MPAQPIGNDQHHITEALPVTAPGKPQTPPVLALSQPIAFVTTADPDRAQKFYEEVLGLRFIADEPYALVFQSAGIMLRIAKADEVTVAPYTILGWKVDDIHASATTLHARGVEFQIYPGMKQDKLGIWNSPSGAKIAWFKDPDGHTLSLTQFAES